VALPVVHRQLFCARQPLQAAQSGGIRTRSKESGTAARQVVVSPSGGAGPTRRRLVAAFTAVLLALVGTRLAGVAANADPAVGSGETVAGVTGVPGSNANQLNRPTGVAVDADGNIYVADSNNDRVQKRALDGVVTTVAVDNGDNELYEPNGVAVDAAGTIIWVASTRDNRVQKWTPDGLMGAFAPGGCGAGLSGLCGPTSVAVDGDGNVYVADTGNHRVQKWTPDDGPVTTVAGGKGSGSDANQLFFPFGVAVDADGNIYVADTGNHRVQKWTPDATEGVTVGGGVAGPAANRLDEPTGVAVDAGREHLRRRPQQPSGAEVDTRRVGDDGGWRQRPRIGAQQAEQPVRCGAGYGQQQHHRQRPREQSGAEVGFDRD
jgi:sugar lactone lactonase YvrE